MDELASLLTFCLRQMKPLSSEGISQEKSLFIEGLFLWPYLGLFCEVNARVSVLSM